MHARTAAHPVRDLRPEVPAELASIVHRLMAKNPADRYQTAEDLCAALVGLLPTLHGNETAAGEPDSLRRPGRKV